MEQTILVCESDQRVQMAIPLTALLERWPGVKVLLKGIVDLAAERCTIQALIIEDLCRMIERCEGSEELLDLSVQVRDLMFHYRPDASRVALTEDEARVLHLLEGVERSR